MINRMTPEKWREVRELYVAGRTAKWLAQRFPVAEATIHRRSSRERWREATLAAEQLSTENGG
ncbi:hypothetical protein CIC12_03595 [Burkholderia sp. SG-MS1]|uniref:hypothetical protein n=1 Tax=Paraburkholderia sp. SG-MS1 TaxID=2023741 RepID=UPI0014459A3E|nr:hypothetical protein [Paraburkholderia sp. SG-MS1]NKJ45840.1 hypothetical protein [Paraburkholderia sp. SG-MS1]